MSPLMQASHEEKSIRCQPLRICMERPSRRRFLRTAGAVGGTTALAGCGEFDTPSGPGNDDGDDNNGNGDNEENSPTIVGGEFLLKQNGDLVFRIQFDTAPTESVAAIEDRFTTTAQSNINIKTSPTDSLPWNSRYTSNEPTIQEAFEKKKKTEEYVEAFEKGPAAELPITDTHVRGIITGASPQVSDEELIYGTEIDIPTIGYDGAVDVGPGDVNVQLPDGQVHRYPLADGKFEMEFENTSGLTIDFEQNLLLNQGGDDPPAVYSMNHADEVGSDGVILSGYSSRVHIGFSSLTDHFHILMRLSYLLGTQTESLEDWIAPAYEFALAGFKTTAKSITPAIKEDPLFNSVAVGTLAGVLSRLATGPAGPAKRLYDTAKNLKNAKKEVSQFERKAEELNKKIGSFDEDDVYAGTETEFERLALYCGFLCRVVVPYSASSADPVDEKWSKITYNDKIWNKINNKVASNIKYGNINNTEHRLLAKYTQSSIYRLAERFGSGLDDWVKDQWRDAIGTSIQIQEAAVSEEVVEQNDLIEVAGEVRNLSSTEQRVQFTAAVGDSQLATATKNIEGSSDEPFKLSNISGLGPGTYTVTVEATALDSGGGGAESNGFYSDTAVAGTVRIPAITDSAIYAHGENEGALHCLDAATGEIAWETELRPDIQASRDVSAPIVADGVVYLAGTVGTLYAFDAATGEILWRYTEFDENLQASPTVVDGTIYIGGPTSDGGELHAISTEGERQWQVAFDGNLPAAPQVTESSIYVVETNGADTLHAVSRDSREIEWSTTIGYWEGSVPSIQDDTIIVALRGQYDGLPTEDAGIVALDRANGDKVWRFQPDASDFRDIKTPVSVTDSWIVTVGATGSGSTLIGFRRRDGGRPPQQVWSKPSNYRGYNSPPVTVDGTVYTVGSLYTGRVSANDIQTGEEFFVQTDIRRQSDTVATIVDEMIYTTTKPTGGDGSVIALDRATGEIQYKTAINAYDASVPPTVVDDPLEGDSIDARVTNAVFNHVGPQ